MKKLFVRLLILSIFASLTTAASAQYNDLSGHWDLDVQMKVFYPAGLNCSFLSAMGDPDIPVSQSGNVLYSSDTDTNNMPFILQGTVNGDSVDFTITGYGITPGAGGCSLASRNFLTQYSGKFDAATQTISGTVDGNAEYSFELDQNGNQIWSTVTWTGTFTVHIKKEHAVPALSQWGMVLFSFLLVASVFCVIRRRRA